MLAAIGRSSRGLGNGPRARVHAARGTRIDAGAAEKHREKIADVRFPIWEGLAAVHHVVGRKVRHRAGVDRVVPVPEVIAEDGIAAPLRQQDVAEVSFSRLAGLDQRLALAAMAQSNHVVEKPQDERYAGRLLLAPILGGILGISVAGPRRRAGTQVAVLGKQIGPAGGGREVSRIPRHLVGGQHGRAELRKGPIE